LNISTQKLYYSSISYIHSYKVDCGSTNREGSLSSSSSQAATASSDSELSLTKLSLPFDIPVKVG